MNYRIKNINYNNKTPFYKKRWLWFVIVIVLIMIFCVSFAYSNEQNNSHIQTNTINSQKGLLSENEFKNSCQYINYKTLARNPNKYKGNAYKLTGKVIQTQESNSDNTVELRVNITEDNNLWLNTIYATIEIPKGNDRILDNDIINFWGRCEGLYTYTGALGSNITLPYINIKYYEIVK